MSLLGRVPISVKLLVSPLVGLVAVAALAAIFVSVVRDHERVLAELESRELVEIVALSKLSARFSSAHARLYGLLIGPDAAQGEEARFEALRPVLFELHRIEEEVEAVAPEESALRHEIEAYRRRAANALLNSAASMEAARRELADATGHFNAANALIDAREERTQEQLRDAVQRAERAARADVRRFGQVAVAAVLATFALSLLASVTVSAGIRRLLASLASLARGELRAEIPMQERADDIGEMARGLARFKTSIETLRLRDRAIESLPSGIAFLERQAAEARIIHVNGALATITGRTGAELIGGPVAALLGDAPDAQSAARRVAAAMDEGREIDLELRCRRASGASYPCEIHVAPIPDPNGGATSFLVIQTDVSERHEMEESLRQAQKMEAVGRLAAGVAHDFNNYLTAIMGNAEGLQLELPKDSPLRELAEQIMLAAERSSDLTRQLLAFGRKQVISVRVIDPNPLVASLQKMLARVLGEHVRVEVTCEEGVGRIQADPAQIEQILVNLAVNARDAMTGGGVITIETGSVYLDDDYVARHEGARPGPHVLLAVRDTGEGMDADTIARIFDPFFTTKEQGHGTGLGLSTVYGAVKQSGGSIDIQSRRGVGTTFRVYLPRYDGEAPGEAAALPPPRVRQGRGESILLVEDQEMVRRVARIMLETAGYQVIEACDGLEALEVAARAEVDLLVTDVVMPRLGGVELATRLLEKSPELPVLYVSGYADARTVQGAQIDPLVNLLHKPFTSTELLGRVSTLLAR